MDRDAFLLDLLVAYPLYISIDQRQYQGVLRASLEQIAFKYETYVIFKVWH